MNSTCKSKASGELPHWDFRGNDFRKWLFGEYDLPLALSGASKLQKILGRPSFSRGKRIRSRASAFKPHKKPAAAGQSYHSPTANCLSNPESDRTSQSGRYQEVNISSSGKVANAPMSNFANRTMYGLNPVVSFFPRFWNMRPLVFKMQNRCQGKSRVPLFQITPTDQAKISRSLAFKSSGAAIMATAVVSWNELSVLIQQGRANRERTEGHR